MISTDKFRCRAKEYNGPITYRSSTAANSNAPANSLNRIVSSEILFDDEGALQSSVVQYIKNSLTCENEEPINGSNVIHDLSRGGRDY